MSTPTAAAGGTHPWSPPAASGSEALAAVCAAAAAVDLDDAGAVADLRARAAEVTAGLAADGRLPHHLVVEPGDPAPAVVRIVAVAWWAVCFAAHGSVDGGSPSA